MPALDAFSKEIVRIVRAMPDDALLALVKHKLGVGGAAAPIAVAPAAPAAKSAPVKKAAPKKAAPKKAAPKKAAPKKAAPKKAAPVAKPAPAAPAAPSKPVAAAKPVAVAKPKKAAKKKAAPKKKAAKSIARPIAKPAKKATPKKSAGGDRGEVLTIVERAVKSTSGIAVSGVIKATGLSASRVAAALKELKAAKRIFQGGDRRFARYAGDARTALSASETARKTASGPAVKRSKRK